jgi:ribosome assembly protein 4
MATLLPPQKRQKIYHENDQNKPEQSSAATVPNIVVQFVSEDDENDLLGPAVTIPADFSREGLEALANKQSSQASLKKLTAWFHLSHAFSTG